MVLHKESLKRSQSIQHLIIEIQMRVSTTAIATPHPDAARAARLAIEQGGNAIDAAAAAMLTLCVVMPMQVGIGGYGGSLVLRTGTGKTVAIDFDTVAPQAFRAELYPNEQTANHGYLALSIPAVIAGLALAIKDHGKLPFSAACKYAADVAEQGFVVSEVFHKQIVQWTTRTDPVSRHALFSGEIPRVGDLWIQKDQAKLLRRLATDGPDAFYHGEIPRAICKQIQAHGGILTEADFASYEPRYVEPLEIEYRGHTILTPPPPSGGLTTLQILKTLEQFDLTKIEPFSAEYYHLFAEATKLCWQDRSSTAGDPAFVEMPIAQLLSSEHAAGKAAQIRSGKLAASRAEKPTGPHTANVLVADADGDLVSITCTQGFLFGSQVVIDGLGLVMGHGMSRFDFDRNSPNYPHPGKRPFHNMAPMIALRDGRSRFAVGLPGGTKIVTVTAQLMVNLIDFGLTPEQAVTAPRIHVETHDPIAASSAVPDAILHKLEAMGHTTRRGQDVGGPAPEIAGNANALAIDPITGLPASAAQAGSDAAIQF
ncbi:MAG TPA: gamma-glutamyltransferase family protein [Tepidisphaeraceae bacterium]|jgi:gamma-glutamyltranspeptidase/glutathione hydrolase|nr:gamma-glutamyltransferase family protein [Tepidisphaeraceae bacterium]